MDDKTGRVSLLKNVTCVKNCVVNCDFPLGAEFVIPPTDNSMPCVIMCPQMVDPTALEQDEEEDMEDEVHALMEEQLQAGVLEALAGGTLQLPMSADGPLANP